MDKYWVKTADMMEDETGFVDQIFGDELDGIQKAVPVAVKDIRQMDPDQRQIWIKAIQFGQFGDISNFRRRMLEE